MAETANATWVLRGTSVVPVDRRTGRAGRPIVVAPLGVVNPRIAAGNGIVAVLDERTNAIVRIDAATRRLRSPVVLPADDNAFGQSIAVGPSGIWVTRLVTAQPGSEFTYYHLLVDRNDRIIRRDVAGPLKFLNPDGQLVSGPAGVWEAIPVGLRPLDPAHTAPVSSRRVAEADRVVVGTRDLWAVRERFGINRRVLITRVRLTPRRVSPPRVVRDVHDTVPVVVGDELLLLGRSEGVLTRAR